MNTATFQNAVRTICSKETSVNPSQWSEGNPLLGHCAVIALLAQDHFGGLLLRGSLSDTEFAHLKSHYWNQLPNGSHMDFTAEQFGGKYPNINGKLRSRGQVLKEDTKERYQKFKKRFEDKS